MARRTKQDDIDAQKPNATPELVAEAFVAISGLEREIAAIKQRMATTFSNYEKQGVDRRALKAALRMSYRDEAQAEHKKATEYLVMLSIISVDEDGQGSFAAALGVPMPAGDAGRNLELMRIYNDGYNTGRQGGLVTLCMHHAGSEEFVKWRDGWDDGQRDRRLAKPDADKVTTASPRRRGRPPKSATPPRNGHDDIGETVGAA